MEQSLCAHCLNCGEIKYDGFFCDITGYLADKDTSEGCIHFKDDAEQFKKNVKTVNKGDIKVRHWLMLYDHVQNRLNDYSLEFRKIYENGKIEDSDAWILRARDLYLTVQTKMMNLTSYPTTYIYAWRELKEMLQEIQKIDDVTESDMERSLCTALTVKMKEIENTEVGE